MNSQQTSLEGKFTVETERKSKGRRTRYLVFRTPEGFVGARPLHLLGRQTWKQLQDEAKADALAQRSRCVYEQQLAAMQELNTAPKPWETCTKPAPVAIVQMVPKLAALSDSKLISELEERGYDIHVKS